MMWKPAAIYTVLPGVYTVDPEGGGVADFY